MNLQEIKNYIALWYADQGYVEYEITDKIIKNIFNDAEVIYTEKDSSSRWYESVLNVVKLGGKYFRYEEIRPIGLMAEGFENSGFNWDSLCEVEPYEVTVIKYKVVK